MKGNEPHRSAATDKVFSSLAYRGSILAILILFGHFYASAEESTLLDRLFKESKASPEWPTATSAAEKLHIVREVALSKDTVSDPVSDRYLITALGGPIDIVHFLGLAIPVCKGERERKELLYYHWKDEGGLEFEAGKTRAYPVEAHPDDLPSNALGALFGEEIKDRNHDQGFDVTEALRTFLKPLEPLVDSIAKRFSHRRIVMGLSENASFETERSRSEWFTAVPIFILFAIDSERAKSIGNAKAALAFAGFEVREFEGRPIVVERISQG